MAATVGRWRILSSCLRYELNSRSCIPGIYKIAFGKSYLHTTSNNLDADAKQETENKTKKIQDMVFGSQKIKTKTTQEKIMEFFDQQDNWGVDRTIRVGRPWKPDELRIKSNTDLHKLWYILLKERNMLLTMHEAYSRNKETFPSPERLEKVEESMENVLDVIAERDEALSELKTGETGPVRTYWTENEIGVKYWRRSKEYYMPKEFHAGLRKRKSLLGLWINKYVRLAREKKIRRHQAYLHRQQYREKELQDKFSD